jgi:aerobic carbon-monoxide dehydrogenase medium subunit
MLLERVEYVRPATVEEAIEALGSQPAARVLAGGQSLINALKLRTVSVTRLVDVTRLGELQVIEPQPDGGLRLGAGVTYHTLAGSPAVASTHPVAADVAEHLVDRQVRSRGTLGGNCCYADPTSNFPPLMVALGAVFRVRGAEGDRDIAAEDFFLGQFRTAISDGSGLLCSIYLPPLGAGDGVGYASLRLGEDSWALARASAWVRVTDGAVADARVVSACASPRPVRQRAVEQRLIGASAAAGSSVHALEEFGEALDPVSDVHATAAYRLAMARVMARRAIEQAIEDAQR